MMSNLLKPERISLRPSRYCVSHQAEAERAEARQRITTRLERRISTRPTAAELCARNILRRESEAEAAAGREERRAALQRKLSIRPSAAQLRQRRILKAGNTAPNTEWLQFHFWPKAFLLQ